MNKLADIGQAQNQPVSIEVMEVAEEELARLRKQNENQAQTIRVQAATIANQLEEIEAFASRSAEALAAVAREDLVKSLLEEVRVLRANLTNTPQNPSICPVEPPLPTLAANVPGEAVCENEAAFDEGWKDGVGGVRVKSFSDEASIEEIAAYDQGYEVGRKRKPVPVHPSPNVTIAGGE